MGRWKGVRLNVHADPDGPIELYDLEKDIAEICNKAERYPKTVDKIRQIIAGVHVRNEAYLFEYEKVQDR